MNKAVVKEISPRRLARIAGVFYLFEFVTGVLSAVFIPGIVSGDAATFCSQHPSSSLRWLFSQLPACFFWPLWFSWEVDIT